MRHRLKTLKSRLRHANPLLWLIAACLAVAGVMALFITATLPASSSDDNFPAFTYAGDWTLLDLHRHLEAGDILAIGWVEAGDPATPQLTAKTTSNQLIRVNLDVQPAEAVGALKSIGYGRLLTTEAIDGFVAAQNSAVNDPSRTWAPVFAFLIIAGVLSLIYVLVRTKRGAGLMGGPGAMHIDTKTADGGVRLDDVAGCDEAKLELTETIEFLRNPQRFVALGAHIPHGILFYGPPGTGKTMLAKAVANEAGVPFLASSGSAFVEKYVGVGASRVREIFANARKAGRAVIFIDELDAVGKTRGGIQSHDEREQTLNQLLVELDGFSTTDGVVVIGATNRIDTLDEALLRPGRFTRKVNVPLPDRKARQAILEVHSKGKPIEDRELLAQIARKSFGFSGAMLADLLNEAAIFAARRGAESISADDLRQGWLKAMIGTSRSRSMNERERSIIAAHEAGHAVCGYLHGDKDRVEEVSLRAHGDALGFTFTPPVDDNPLPAEGDLRARLIRLMGGRAAEHLLFHEVTGGARDDFAKANDLAEQMVKHWGLGIDPDDKTGASGRGRMSFLVERDGKAPLPADIQSLQSRAIAHLLDESYSAALQTLSAHLDDLARVSAYLFENERIDGDEFEAVMKRELHPQDEQEWRAAAARPRSWAEVRQLGAPRLIASVVDRLPPAGPVSRTPRRRGARVRMGVLLQGLSRRAVAALVGREEAV